jgi:poly(A) polymerase
MDHAAARRRRRGLRSDAPPGRRATIHHQHPISPDWLHPGALDVLRRLRKGGYETYFTGGCVRDFMLGIRALDFDVATAASQATVDALFFGKPGRRRLPSARTLPAEDDIIIDIIPFGAPPWADLARWRHQRRMEQTSVAEAFVKSFDFTINALYYDPAENVVIDFVNGVDDIRTGTLRLVRPTEFRLDIVSVLRGVTQCAKKNLKIDGATWEAMRSWAAGGDLCSRKPSQVFSNMVKALGSGVAARSIDILERMGAMTLLLGRHALPRRELVRVKRLLAGLDRLPAPGQDISLLFAAFFHRPIEIALDGTVPRTPSRSREEWAARERALSDGIESNLRALAEPFSIPGAIYRDTCKALLAVRLIGEGRSAERWRGAFDEPWWKTATRLVAILRDAEACDLR